MSLTLFHLRVISFIEGLSYLFLLFVGMPLKYGAGIPNLNMILGQIHGILSVILFVILLMVLLQKRLSFLMFFLVFLLSLIPFGAFYAEYKLRKLDT